VSRSPAANCTSPIRTTTACSSCNVADTGNNRIVSFSTLPSASGALADGVLGQADLTRRTAAVGVDDLAHLAGPAAIAADGENLYVADRELGTLKSGAAASLFIAAPTGVSLSAPQGIAVEPTAFFTSRLYVADTGNNQVAVVQSVTRLASF
jgi:hypothetical protein